ncbi:MAG: hypothetical protein JNL75_01055, partial [Chitinophagales bacterium]|nr:hypothetical protein [Chitinophagales bacterium]
MKKLVTVQHETKVSSSCIAKWWKGCLIFSIILLAGTSLLAQTFTSINAPSVLVSCTTRDTVSVTVLNNSGGPVTNLRIVPTMGGFRYVSTVANANVTVLNASATAPIIQINSLAAGASQNVRFFIEAGCSANTGSMPIQLQTSGGTLITSQNTPIMTVYQPTLGMTGTLNTSISPSNESSAGILSNLVNGQTLVKGFRMTSNNSSAPLDEVRVYVLNTLKYWESIGISRGTRTILGSGDTIMYTFGPADFMTMGDGDGLFESTDGPFNFTDTMRLIGCNSDVTTNTSLKYFAAWGCFAPPVYCDKSADVDAYASIRAANDNILIENNPLNHPVPTMCSSGPNDTTAKMSFRIRNSNNEAGVAGSGTIYDLVIRLGKGDYPFNNDTFVGNQHIKILAAKVNGQIVPFSRTSRFGVRIENLTSAQYTGGGLQDIDGDGFLDDLRKDSSVIVELFCNFRPAVATSYGSDNLQGGSNRATYIVTKSDSVSYGYSSDAAGSATNMLIAATQWKCNIVYKTPCKDKSITKSGYYLYTYWNSMPATSSLNPDFYNNQQNIYTITVREEYNYLNAYPRINNGSQYADSMISEFKVILPPGINLDSFSGRYGSGYNRTRVFQSEVNGPGDYDTATVRYARRMGGGGGAQDLQVYLKLDCSQLTNQCPGLDSVKWYSWQHIYPTSGATSPCHSTIVNWGYRPMRYHCNSYFKGLKMTSYTNKRITMGVRRGDTSINAQSIDPNSSFANSDSIDRQTYLTYDTVIMQMRGVVTDTALAEPYVKVIIDKINYNQYGFRTDLNRSSVRIYDASTATYRSFKLGYFNIVNEPGGGNLVRTMYIPLKQYVDSMRAFDPTYLIGGNVGSTVYTQDSVLIDYYYHYGIIGAADSLANTNRDIEIFYTAEYRNDSLTGSRTCDLFSEYNRLIEFFNYSYQDNYNAVLNGPCYSGGSVLVDFYFENRGQSGDWFRNEWHNNNSTQRIEYNYNPTILSDPDSIYYSATIYQEFGDIISYRKLPANKYTVVNGKVTIFIDSILGGRKQQNLGPLGVIFYMFQQPTCAAAGARQDLIGSIGVNTVDMYYNPHANADLNINQKYSRGSTARADLIPNNSIIVSANPASVNMAQTDTLTWTINYRNNSSNRFNHAWMDFRSPGLNVVKVEDITGAPINKPIFTYFLGDVQQWAKLDTILAGATRTYKIYATLSGCKNDTLNVTLGYNCKYYPVDPSQGYLPPYLYSCNSEQRKIALPVGIPPYQLQWAKISETPASPINLCDTITYTSRITNLNLSNLSQIKLNVTLPTGSNIQYLANSALLQWPEGGSYLSMGVTPTTSGGVMTFDLSSKFRGGVLPNSITPLDSNKALVRMRFITGCPFASGDQIPSFGITAKQPCGDVITGTGHTSQVLRINGLPVSPLTQLMGKIVSIDTLGVCGDTSTMRFRVLNTGGSPTGTRHSFTWEMPSDMNFVAGSAVASVPARLVSVTPTNTVVGNKRILKWSMSSTAMNVNDSLTITFRSINTNSFLTCGSTNTASLRTLESHTVGAACAPGGNCDVDFIIDNKLDTIRVDASRFSLSNLVVSSVSNSPMGETVSYSVTITNNGEPYTGNYMLKFFGNVTGNDSVGIRTISGGLARGASANITGTLNVPAGKACNLRIKLDSTGCFCSYPTISGPYRLNVALKDSTICSGATLPLGAGTITGYSYFWNDGTLTANNNKTFTNTDPNNNRMDTNIVVIDRMVCTSSDTTVTTVKPNPQGLTITPDNTCLLTNPITFTASSTSSGVTYSWTFPGGGSSTTNPTDRTMLAGTQNVIINATKNGCATTYNESFVFYDLNNAATADNPVVCFNSSTLLRANSSNATNFQWYR